MTTNHAKFKPLNEARLFGGTLNERGQALFRFVLRDGASVSIALDREELARLYSTTEALLAENPVSKSPR
jgi:hypothetical protein